MNANHLTSISRDSAPLDGLHPGPDGWLLAPEGAAVHAATRTAVIADAKRMQSINPDSAITSRALYLFYWSLNISDLALKFARRAAALDPLSIAANSSVAYALNQQTSLRHSDTAAQRSMRTELPCPSV